MILAKNNSNEFNFESLINSRIQNDKLDSLLIIVPTNRKLRDLKKKIINNFSDKPVSTINIETIATLATKLLKAHKNFILLSEAAATILIKESAEQLELTYFATYSKGIPFGTLDKIKNVIAEYKKHGISPSTLQKESKKLSGGERSKACDIAKIYNLYLEKCDLLSALEVGDIYLSILELNKIDFEKYFSSIYKNVTSILLDGFDEFTKLEINLLDSLSTIVRSGMIINFDYYQYNQDLFSHLTNTYNQLTAKGFREIRGKSKDEKNIFKKIICENLFCKTVREVNQDYKNIIFKAETKNRIDEIELIAKTIKLKIIQENISPEDICVGFNIIGHYSNIVRDIFNKYGIPLNLTDRIPLKISQPVIASISILELVENDFYFNDLIRVLSNGFLHIDSIDLNNLLIVANELKITSGLQNWESSIDDALSILMYNDEISENEKQKKSDKYKKAKLDILGIAKIILPFRKKTTKDEFIFMFKEVLLKLQLPQKVLIESNGSEEEFIKSITVLLQTLEEVLDLVDSERPNKKYSLHFYIDQLRTISNWARFNVKEKSDYGVLVTSINEIRGLKFKYLYLGGLSDGDFPTRYSPEIFFSGSFQKKERIHQMEERYLFYQALCAWEKELILTIPQNDSEAKLVNSTFVNDIEKLFKFSELKEIDQLQILSEEQLQISYVQNNDNSQLKDSLNEIGINSESLLRNNDVRIKKNEDPKKDFEYSGFIGSNADITNYLNDYSNKEFSISQLETFAKCPFKYFSERILKLEPLEEPTDEAKPIELGNVLHSILYEFYSKIVGEKIPIGRVGSPEFANLNNILFEIAEDKIGKLNLNSQIAFFEKEKILGICGSMENSILYKFLLTETESDTSFSPAFFEYNFGNFAISDQKRTVSPLTIGELKLRGKIDRIDINEEAGLFNIIDYKLKGKKPTSKELTEGLSLQLPVYLMAGEHILNGLSEDNYVGDKMIIYSLDFKAGNFGPINVKVKDQNLIPDTREKLKKYHQKIKKGSFNLSELEDREEKVCRYCDYRSFCRVNEVFEE